MLSALSAKLSKPTPEARDDVTSTLGVWQLLGRRTTANRWCSLSRVETSAIHRRQEHSSRPTRSTRKELDNTGPLP
jgi:hypothetical protein